MAASKERPDLKMQSGQRGVTLRDVPAGATLLGGVLDSARAVAGDIFPAPPPHSRLPSKSDLLDWSKCYLGRFEPTVDCFRDSAAAATEIKAPGVSALRILDTRQALPLRLHPT